MKSKFETQVRASADKSEEIGDLCLEKFKASKKIAYAKTGISAYRNVLYANRLLLLEKKD